MTICMGIESCSARHFRLGGINQDYLLLPLLQVSAHNARKKILESSSTVVDFMKKYAELKSKK